MNCLESQELVQRFLDGEALDARRTELEPHLAICANCRELHAASQRLLDGLRLMPPALPPDHLARNITAQALRQGKRSRLQKRVAMTAALAASLMLAVLAGYRSLRPGPLESADSTSLSAAKPAAGPSLDQSVAEAGIAVVALTRRTADETVGQSRWLLPVVVPDVAEPLPALPNRETIGPLQEVRQTVSAGLEPVATSARRAVDLFLREIPPLERKRGL
jgi:predicted anti-sigma-YlaC factor YlaD